MEKLSFVNKNVVITGAASGLGRELAKQLAITEKANLILADLQHERLLQLKEEIENQSPASVHTITVDLSTDTGADFLFQRATEVGDIFALINNAGIGFYGRTLDQSLSNYKKLIQVNFLTVVTTTTMFLEYFLKKGIGAILNITSMGAFLSNPFQNVYAASKHATQTFTEGLSYEYRKKEIVFCTFAPGGIATEMITKIGLDKRFGKNHPAYMHPSKAARRALKAFKKRKLFCFPGMSNKLFIFLRRLFPLRLRIKLAGVIYAPKKK